MRRTWAVATLAAAGLFLAAACDGSGGGGGTGAICERVQTDSAEASERFVNAGLAINQAAEADDQLGMVEAVTDAQNAAADMVDVYREGASDADDEELSAALDAVADEIETLMANVDPEAIAAGEVPDYSGYETAVDEVDAICENV